MRVTKRQVVDLLHELKVVDAATWPDAVVAEKLNKRGGITRYQATVDERVPLRGAKARLFIQLAAAYNQGVPIEIAPAPEPRTGTARTRRKAAKRRVRRHHKPVAELAVWSRDDLSWAEKRKLWRDRPARLYADGVIVAIIRQLRTAGIENKPVTKAAILEALAVQFPDRNVDQMRQTVNNQVPSQLREQRGLYVTSKTIGQGAVRAYWIPWNRATDEAVRERLGFDLQPPGEKSKNPAKRRRA